MSVTFTTPIKFGDLTTSSSYTVKCGDLHSMIFYKEPEFSYREEFYHSTQTSVALLSGVKGRTMMVNAIINDATYTTLALFEAGLDSLREYLGAQFTLTVTKGSDTQTHDFVFLKQIERLTRRETAPVALPNYVAAPVGPAGNYWLEVNLHFLQPQVQ